VDNRQFNRKEINNENYYIQEFGYNFCQDFTYTGYIKCKLVHNSYQSIIVPDQIYLESDKLLWIQPLNFFPNILYKEDDLIIALLNIDISCGNTIKIEFRNKDFIRSYEDGANLFKCKIYGPTELDSYATGTCYLTGEYIPFLHLYHHTTEANKQSIINSGYFLLSPWNIQGNKTLSNIGYVYLTSLDKIKTDNDLRQIAMASNEKMYFITDNVDIPSEITNVWKYKHSSEILELKVYRETTKERESTLSLKVNATTLSPQHLLRHSFKSDPVFYEIISQFIYRVGASPQNNVYFEDFTIKRENNNIKQLDYIICGDATTIKGLESPFDEENTSSIFKIEKCLNKSCILDFWFENCNKDHFSNKSIEIQSFNKNE